MSNTELKLLALSMCIDINDMFIANKTNINLHVDLYATGSLIVWIYDGKDEVIEKLETYDLSMNDIVSKLSRYHSEIVENDENRQREINTIRNEIIGRYESSNLKAEEFKNTLIKCIANIEEAENV